MVVLALVVLLTGVVVVYFSRAVTDRQLASSTLNQARADDMARSALAIITSQFRQEIANAGASQTTTVGDIAVYTPLTETYMLPVRHGVPTAPSPATPNLVRVSSPADIPAPGVDFAASSLLSTETSGNGRSISLARWNRHYLLPRNPDIYGGGNAGKVGTDPVSSFTAPSWIFLTSAGPASPALTAPSPAVTGRYAYAVYDTGGLLDVNVAGYPSTLGANDVYPAPDTANHGRMGYGGKGSVAFADLQALGLTPAQVDNLVGWRNYASAQPAGSFGAFAADAPMALRYYDRMAGESSGHVRTSGAEWNGRTDQALPGRQDFLELARVLGIPQDSLQYFTTFHRSLAAPTWAPTADAPSLPYAARAQDTASANRDIPNVRVGTAFVRHNGATAVPGEPLLRTRFSLRRLALVRDDAVALAGGGTDIDKYFGLTRDSTSQPWTYRQGATTILTLAQVAQAGREPDYFELLKASILSGSLGKGSNSDVGVVSRTLDRSADAQIIQIGANLIDQCDADSVPTAVKFAAFDPIYGVENLPYIDQIYLTIFRPNRGDPKYPTLEGWMQFSLWNPHGNAAQNTASTKFRIVGEDGKLYVESSNGTNYVSPQQDVTGQSLDFTATGSVFAEPRLLVPGPGMTGGTTIAGAPVDSVSQPSFYFGTTSQPSLAPSSSSTTGLVSSPCHLVGFYMGGVINTITGVSPRDRNITAVTTDPASQNYYHPRTAIGAGGKYATFSLQLQDSAGTWRTYQTVQTSGVYMDLWNQTGWKSCTTWLTGRQGLGSAWPASGLENGTAVGTGLAFGKTAFFSMDPRTKRGGMMRIIALNACPIVANMTLRPATTSARVDTEPLSNGGFPSNPAGFTMWRNWTTNGKFQPALLADNKPTQSSNVTDWDGVMRRGDGDESNGVRLLGQSVSANVGNPLAAAVAARPVVLNRAFRSVGEMGYAMRGDPWKSLNFFSGDSADAALLDVFTLDDTEIAAGKVNLNTRQPLVLSALLRGANKSEGATAVQLTPTEADAIAGAIVNATSVTPLRNVSDLAVRLGNSLATTPGAFTPGGDGYIKARREAAVRALAGVADTRTWNLTIDVIAQSGRFAPAATELRDFLVEGERRYWLHVAIDRYTGQIISQQLEAVYE
ncbi:hypothetical protein DB346_06005 [Verrucomicrobia bacterium LW23]|nr:hypothetical protein DB346_06005 [Verrucomicrobia bacterium LW23]